MSKVEQTLSLIKPDAVERNLEDEIKQFFIKSGFKITKQKKVKFIKSKNIYLSTANFLKKGITIERKRNSQAS